ncbi:MAG: hypoxanthine phosphoribosyltransferase [Anaerolineaceae bacterium]|nr:hypoxanthine phosphoribosyltransferase [Anaerolineaceae bacterium]
MPFASRSSKRLISGGCVRDYKYYLSEVLIPQEALEKRIAELGEQISLDYKYKGELVLVCILRGGVLFLTDLIRKISIPHAIEFMAVSSYGLGGRESTGQVRITLDLNLDIFNKHVLLVEDIIDSGHTISAVTQFLATRRPASISVCTLLDKEERREVPVPIRYRGFTIPNKFVFGYGLDLDDYYRNLPFIGVVDLNKYNEPE